MDEDYHQLKEELGLDHYEGRSWNGWHHHVTMVMLAHSFLMLETLRSKKNFWVDSGEDPVWNPILALHLDGQLRLLRGRGEAHARPLTLNAGTSIPSHDCSPGSTAATARGDTLAGGLLAF